MTATPGLRCYYWGEERFIQNFGDALTPLILRGLGYHAVSCKEHQSAVINPRQCLLVIGSLLFPLNLESLAGPIDVWGCGWRGQALSPELHRRIRFHAVRGPLTIAGLGLASDLPVGDPALLLPHFFPKPARQHGRILIVPHIDRVLQMSARQRCRMTGCNEFLSTRVIGSLTKFNRRSVRPLLQSIQKWSTLGIQTTSLTHAIKRIAGAHFVLSGSLHAAIVAQAYGVPWAAYDGGYVNAPAKWQDWAAYLGVKLAFAQNLTEGHQWWEQYGHQGHLRSMTPLLRAFPYPSLQSKELMQALT